MKKTGKKIIMSLTLILFLLISVNTTVFAYGGGGGDEIATTTTSTITPLTDEQVKEIIFMYQAGKVYSKEGTTRIQDNNYIRVLTGLTKEDEVVVAPYSAISKKLKDAMEVTKVKKEDLFDEKK